MDETDTKVIEIVSEQMGVDKSEITRETHFINDLNADSLDTVELVMEFEDEFELSIPDEVPPIESDRVRVSEIMANLVDNALKYSPDEAVVEVGARALDGYLQFWVLDRGVGNNAAITHQQNAILAKAAVLHFHDLTTGGGGRVRGYLDDLE